MTTPTPTTVQVKIQLRRDTAATWSSVNPVLLAGEAGLETDTNKIKIGNGSTAWNSLGYFPFVVNGGTVTGNLEIGTTGTLTFEGSSADNFETTLGVIDPTADRTINLPNVSGTIITTGDTGTVTSTMIADGTIVNADVSATAEIAVSKLANGTANQVIVTDGTNVSWSDDLTIAGNLTVNGTTTTISTQNLLVEDKNIIIGDVATPTDTTADGGGITLKGATDKTINWVDATDAWTSSERFSVPLGSAASPSLTFTGDTNTGIYSPGADQVAVATNGTGRLFVDASGRVGLGVAAPLENLHVKTGDSGVTSEFGGVDGVIIESAAERTGGLIFNTPNDRSAGVYFSDPDGASRGYYRYDHNGDYAHIATAGSERLRITSSGRVGIGTTSPGAALDVVTGADGILGRFQGADSDVFEISGESGSIALDTRNTTNGLNFQIQGSSKMQLDTSGRLLVGASSDSGGALLQVNGNRIRVATAKTPASATDTGTTGEICWDASYIYVCTATNTWKRTAISTW